MFVLDHPIINRYFRYSSTWQDTRYRLLEQWKARLAQPCVHNCANYELCNRRKSTTFRRYCCCCCCCCWWWWWCIMIRCGTLLPRCRVINSITACGQVAYPSLFSVLTTLMIKV